MEVGTLSNNSITRRQDLDFAKGLGIVLVVWAHAYAPFTYYINQFHMPLFFFISGMLYKAKCVCVKDYIVRKGKSLLLPFWFWNLLFYPVFAVLFYWKNWSAITILKDIIRIVFTLDKVPFLGATWFLPALFFVSVLVHIVSRISNTVVRNLLLVVIMVVSYLTCIYVELPYRFNRTLMLSVFYICGYFYNLYISQIISRKNKRIIGILLGIGAIIIMIAIRERILYYSPLFMIAALFAVLFCLLVSKEMTLLFSDLRLTKHIIYLGKKSLSIVIWQFLAFRIVIIFQIIFLRAPLSSITAFPVYDSSGLWWILYIVAGIYGSLLWDYILLHNPLTPKLKNIHVV